MAVEFVKTKKLLILWHTRLGSRSIISWLFWFTVHSNNSVFLSKKAADLSSPFAAIRSPLKSFETTNNTAGQNKLRVSLASWIHCLAKDFKKKEWKCPLCVILQKRKDLYLFCRTKCHWTYRQRAFLHKLQRTEFTKERNEVGSAWICNRQRELNLHQNTQL